MIVNRDMTIVDWINTVGVADSSQIQRMFFDRRDDGEEIKFKDVVCRKRLAELVKKGYLKRERAEINKRYHYWIDKNKPKQLAHRLMMTEFVVRLHEYRIRIKDKEYIKGNIVDYRLQKQIEDIRPDVAAIYEIPDTKFKIGATQYFFVEVHLSNNSINDVIGKYEDYYFSMKWQKRFPVFPKIIILSNKKVKFSSKLNVKFVHFDLEAIEKISDRDMDMIFG